MNAPHFNNTLELSEQVLSQMTNAIEQVVLIDALRKIEDKLNQIVDNMNQMEVGHTEVIMNKKQACAYLQVQNNTLDKWIREGLKITKVDRTIRIKKSDIDAFMIANQYLQ